MGRDGIQGPIGQRGFLHERAVDGNGGVYRPKAHGKLGSGADKVCCTFRREMDFVDALGGLWGFNDISPEKRADFSTSMQVQQCAVDSGGKSEAGRYQDGRLEDCASRTQWRSSSSCLGCSEGS